MTKRGTDCIIDLALAGGNEDIGIVAEGTPEDAAEVEGSRTGRFLKRMLGKA